jgi:hypothetical protein
VPQVMKPEPLPRLQQLRRDSSRTKVICCQNAGCARPDFILAEDRSVA